MSDKKKLHDFIGCKKVQILCTDGDRIIGRPVDINYGDESASGEDELIVNTLNGMGYCLRETHTALSLTD